MKVFTENRTDSTWKAAYVARTSQSRKTDSAPREKGNDVHRVW